MLPDKHRPQGALGVDGKDSIRLTLPALSACARGVLIDRSSELRSILQRTRPGGPPEVATWPCCLPGKRCAATVTACGMNLFCIQPAP